jgi:hypothetical protein
MILQHSHFLSVAILLAIISSLENRIRYLEEKYFVGPTCLGDVSSIGLVSIHSKDDKLVLKFTSVSIIKSVFKIFLEVVVDWLTLLAAALPIIFLY